MGRVFRKSGNLCLLICPALDFQILPPPPYLAVCLSPRRASPPYTLLALPTVSLFEVSNVFPDFQSLFDPAPCHVSVKLLVVRVLPPF